VNTLTKTDIAALDLAIARTLADPEQSWQLSRPFLAKGTNA